MKITTGITNIIDHRLGRNAYTGRGRVDDIQTSLAFLERLLGDVERLSRLKGTILSQHEKKEGAYYVLTSSDPSIIRNIQNVDVNGFLARLKSHKLVLEKMLARFSRERIYISIVGLARQGKSKLLQTITGLPGNIIPTSDGTDCTGAPSTIVNRPGQPVTCTVTFLTEAELVESINRYIAVLFPEKKIADIPGLLRLRSHLEELRQSCTNEGEKFKHFRKYIEHFEKYSAYLGKVETITDPDRIERFVAQHNNKTGADKVEYFIYLAVKEARIECPFPFVDAENMVLIDTIGLGDTALGIEDKMLKTISDDSDATIFLRRPNPGGDNWNNRDSDIRKKLEENTLQISPEKWLYVVLNKQKTTQFDNMSIIGDFAHEVEKLRPDTLRCAFVNIVDCSSTDAVYGSIIQPLLENLVANLDEIDMDLMRKANDSGGQLYNAYCDLCNGIMSVLSSSIKKDTEAGCLFDRLYDELKLPEALQRLYLAYRKNSNRKEARILSEINRIIDTIYSYVPSQEEIIARLRRGTKDSYMDNVYNYFSDYTRTKISDSFEQIGMDVILPMQEEVKLKLVELLYREDTGKLGDIVLKGKTYESPSIEWLHHFSEEKLRDYPSLYKAFRFIEEYKLSIEGLLAYLAERSLSLLDPDTKDFRKLKGVDEEKELEEKADYIWEQIINNLTPVEQSLRGSFDELATIPSNSFFAYIRKFREKVILSDIGSAELKEFYRNHSFAIWHKEFAKISATKVALGEWNELCDGLNSYCKESYFLISLTK